MSDKYAHAQPRLGVLDALVEAQAARPPAPSGTDALAAYPTGAVTDRTFLALDHADCLRQEGYPRDAARHATQTLLSLTPECTLPVLLDRADEVADAIGTAGHSDTDDLREVLRSTRGITDVR